MTVEYRRAPAAEKIGARLIKAHHEHLAEARVEYVFRDTAATDKGRIVLGKARKLSGLNAWLATDHDERGSDPEDFFVIELAEDEWGSLSDAQRVALVDHELSHCWLEFDDDGEPKLSLRTHDVEEFVAVVQRHGLWRNDLVHLVKVGNEQLALEVGE
jgi:predicted metallopeptidase